MATKLIKTSYIKRLWTEGHQISSRGQAQFSTRMDMLTHALIELL